MRAVLVVALVGLTSACVSQERFRKQEAEADQLRSRSAELETALANSQRELEKARETARETARDLQAKVDELSRSKSTLESAKTELGKKSTGYERMANALRGQIESGRIELTELRGKMTVKMKDKILFSSGSTTIGKEGKDALRAVAEVLSGVQGKVIRVEGHTDNVPLGRSAFATNWELSVARALTVVRFLQESGVEPTRLAAAGYGEYQPISQNDRASRRTSRILGSGSSGRASRQGATTRPEIRSLTATTRR